MSRSTIERIKAQKLMQRVKQNISTNKEFGEDISRSLKSDIIARGLPSDIAENAVTGSAEFNNGKIAMHVRMSTNASYDEPYKQTLDALEAQTDKHGSFTTERIAPAVSDQMILKAHSKEDIIYAINAAVLNPDARINTEKYTAAEINKT